MLTATNQANPTDIGNLQLGNTVGGVLPTRIGPPQPEGAPQHGVAALILPPPSGRRIDSHRRDAWMATDDSSNTFTFEHLIEGFQQLLKTFGGRRRAQR